MKKAKTTIALSSAILVLAAIPTQAQNASDQRIAELLAEIQRLSARTKKSEQVVLRGTPQRITQTQISVFVPENASNIQIKAFMKNEPWGGAQSPPKPNTDDLGSTRFMECPTGSGECPIGWSRVGQVSQVSLPNGRTRVSATFFNWAHRNDRTGKLEVNYQLD